MMNFEALVPICILMEATQYLLWKSTHLMREVLNTVGFKAEHRFLWSVGRQKKIRRATAPGKLVADKDQFWRDLEKKNNDALKLLQWFKVSTQSLTSEDFEPLSNVLDLRNFVVRKQDIPAGFENLVKSVNQAMDSLNFHIDKVLYGPAGVDETRKTVKLIVDVFERVHVLLNHVVPLIRDELLEVTGGPSNKDDLEKKYKLKERDETGDIHLAKRMEEVMLKRTRDISSLASTTIDTNDTRGSFHWSNLSRT